MINKGLITMTLIEAFKKVYLEDTFTIRGRASRKEFWGSELIFIPLYFITLFIGYLISDGFGDLVGSVGSLWTSIAALTASIRRAHDVGKSGWFMLIPFYNFYLQISPSDQASNKWGDPRPHTITQNDVLENKEGEENDLI
jgi:uncharacterized membrane protein YhaH (DUF805 family)